MDYYSGLMVNKDMVKELRLYDLSDTFIDRYDDAFERYYKGMRRLIIGEGGWHVGFALLSSVVNCIFFAMIAYRVFTGEIMIGDYTLLTGALTSIAGSVSTLISASSTVYEGTLFIDNLMTFMDYEQTIAPRIATPLKVRHGEQHTIAYGTAYSK